MSIDIDLMEDNVIGENLYDSASMLNPSDNDLIFANSKLEDHDLGSRIIQVLNVYFP